MKGFDSKGGTTEKLPKVRNPYLDPVLRILPATYSKGHGATPGLPGWDSSHHIVTDMTVEKPLTPREPKAPVPKFTPRTASKPKTPLTPRNLAAIARMAQYYYVPELDNSFPLSDSFDRPLEELPAAKSPSLDVSSANATAGEGPSRFVRANTLSFSARREAKYTTFAEGTKEESFKASRVNRRDSGFCVPSAPHQPNNDRPSFTRDLIHRSPRRPSAAEIALNRRLSAAERAALAMSSEAGNFSSEELSEGLLALSQSGLIPTKPSSAREGGGHTRRR